MAARTLVLATVSLLTVSGLAAASMTKHVTTTTRPSVTVSPSSSPEVAGVATISPSPSVTPTATTRPSVKPSSKPTPTPTRAPDPTPISIHGVDEGSEAGYYRACVNTWNDPNATQPDLAACDAYLPHQQAGDMPTAESNIPVTDVPGLTP